MYYSATDENQAQHFIDMCADVCKFLGIEVERSSQKLTMPNGSVVYGVSSNPKTLRGKSADICLDEFGFHEEGEQLLQAAIPCTTRGYKLEIVSTQSNEFHPFYKTFEAAYTGKLKGYKTFRTDVFDAINQGFAVDTYRLLHNGVVDKLESEINKEFIEDLKSRCTDAAWITEFECQVAKSGLSLIPSELYKKLMVRETIPSSLDGKTYGPLYVGYDIARSHDLSVIWVYEYVGRNANLVCILELSGMPYQEQFEAASRIVGHNMVRRCYVDRGAIGSQIAEDLLRKFGNIVEPYSIGHTQKCDMFAKLEKFAQQERLNYPNDDRVMQDICSVRRTFSDKGMQQITGGTSFSHADFANACALALLGIPEVELGRAWTTGKKQSKQELINAS